MEKEFLNGCEQSAPSLEQRRMLGGEATVRATADNTSIEAPTLEEAWAWVEKQRVTGLLPVNVE